jgi:hypothetical protein
LNIPTPPTAGLRPHSSNWTNEPEKANTHCLYCKEPVPNHALDCTVPLRTVVVELKINMVITMPQCFNEDLINFSMNGSSACSQRYIDQLYEEGNQEDGVCTACDRMEMKYLREATEQDYKDLHYMNKDPGD